MDPSEPLFCLNPVEECARITTAQMILSHGLTSVHVDEMSVEKVARKSWHGCCACIVLLVEAWRPGRRKLSVARLDGQHHDRARGDAERDRSEYEDQLDRIPLRTVSRQSITNEHEGQ